jgi:haloacetate dehalogenase
MFEGFALETVDLPEASLRVRRGGSGPAVLLLHGHPRTHATWHRVAPLLAGSHAVVCPDLRGYGRSSKPPTTADHAPYSKRAVVGHDRGAYVAFRAAMDHPGAVGRLVVLDAVPIVEALERCDARFAASWWHWFFFAQPGKPERATLADPDAWYGGSPERMGAEAYEDHRAAIHDPATVHAMVEDYRAGLGLDRAHDEEDRRAGRRVARPTRLLWARRDDLEDLYGDPLAVWRAWAPELSGRGLDCGHHMAEEAPEELAGELLAFLRG